MTLNTHICANPYTTARVELSDTFSADPFCFSSLRALLLENLWTSLIQIRSALKNKVFRAANSAKNIAVSALISSETALFQRWFWLNSQKFLLMIWKKKEFFESSFQGFSISKTISTSAFCNSRQYRFKGCEAGDKAWDTFWVPFWKKQIFLVRSWYCKSSRSMREKV